MKQKIKKQFNYSLVDSRWKNKNMKILIAGAGGIGCELIKNLFKINSYAITIIDYDTISESNLNRQFCYRKQDINKYKVDSLYAYFKNINPKFVINVEKNNLFDYDSLYFSQFDLLISALDNNQARKYLNFMAIDNNIPMIDAGTAGFNGQAMFYMRYLTECRMCRDQSQPEGQYAVCTLRGRPQKNIHCIQFSINVYNQICMMCNQIENKSSNHISQGEWLGIKKYIETFQTCLDETQKYQICVLIHNQLFFENMITNQLEGVNPIKYQLEQEGEILKQLKIEGKQQNILKFMQKTQNQQRLYIKQIPRILYSYFFLQTLMYLLTKKSNPLFDKDDFQSTFFVYAATNLRIANFKSLSQSKLKFISYYQCKDQSGKIIPSIASTNSMAAALQIILFNRLLYKPQIPFGPTYISIKGYLSDQKIEQYLTHRPKIGCPHCSALYNCAHIYSNFGKVSWGQLQTFLTQNFDQCLKKRDIRSGQFVIVRNSSTKPWVMNKTKLLDFNKKIIKQSKIGLSYMTIMYVGCQKYANTWKFILINKQNVILQVGKGLSKGQYQQFFIKQMQKVQNNRIHPNYSSKSSIDDIIIQQ